MLESDTSYAAEYIQNNRNQEETLPLVKKASTGKNFKGIIFALIATFVYSLATLILKLFKNYHPFTVSIWRFQGMILPSIPIILYHVHKREPVFSTILPLNVKDNQKAILFIFIRSVIGCTSTVFQIYAIHHLTLADASIITFSTPVFVILMGHVFLKEKAGFISVLTAIFTFVGVLIIARPPILTGEALDHNTLVGSLYAVASMVLSTFVYITLRYLRNVHYSIVTISYGIIGSVECLILALSMNVFQFPSTKHEWLLATLLILFTFGGQTLLIIALKYEQAGPVALMQSTDVIISFILQFIFLQVVPDFYSLTGATIVLLGVGITTLRKWIITLPDDHEYKLRFKFII